MSDYEYWDTTTGEPLDDHDLEQRFRDFLDEIYGEVEVAGYTYSTSRTLEEIDPTAFRTGFNDWLDSELRNDTLTDEEPTEDEGEDEDEDD